MSNHKLLLVGLLSFALTLAASITSTYAWYNVSTAGAVSFLDFAINESHSLQIGLKNGDGSIAYYENINDHILGQHYSNYVSGKPLSDLSSMYESLWLNEDTDYENDFPILRQPYISDDYHASIPAQKGFYQFEFFFKADSDMYLFLDANQTYAKPNHEANQAYVDVVNQGKEEDRYIYASDLDNVVNACRVSFFSEDGYYIYEPNALTGSTTVFGGILDANRDGYFDFNESGKEVVYGEYDNDAIVVYDPAESEDSTIIGTETCFNSKHKAGIQRFNKEKSEAAGLSFKKETTYTIEELGLGEGQGSFDSSTMTPLAKLRSGESKRLVVTIYLEGWDLDVVESIGNGSFNLNLGFKGLAQPFED